MLPASHLDTARPSSRLSAVEAARRLEQDGPNLPRSGRQAAGFDLVLRAVGNPLVVLLGVLAASSFASGDPAAGGVMAVLLGAAVGLRLVQEARATAATRALESMIAVHATVVRDGAAREVPIGDLVRGDVIQLAVGDMVPADVRLVAAKDLTVTQAMLLGESFPVEKHAGPDPDPMRPPLTQAGHVVGFLGDGANDAAGLREADVGISVNTAVDLARESADCILLDKDLLVLWEGVREGRGCSSTCSSTCGWGPVPTSATCSACWERAGTCRTCQ